MQSIKMTPEGKEVFLANDCVIRLNKLRVIYPHRMMEIIGVSNVVLYIIGILNLSIYIPIMLLLIDLYSLPFLLSTMNKPIMILLMPRFEFIFLNIQVMVFVSFRLTNWIINNQHYANKFNLSVTEFTSSIIIGNVIGLVFYIFSLSLDSYLSLSPRMRLIFNSLFTMADLTIMISTPITHDLQSSLCVLKCSDLDSISLNSMSILFLFHLKYSISLLINRNKLFILKYEYVLLDSSS